MAFKICVGEADFAALRNENAYYVDTWGREDFVCSKRGETTKKFSFGWHTIFVLWRICYV